MKAKRLFVMLIAIISLMACEKEKDSDYPSLDGTYVGTLSFSETLNSSLVKSSEGTAVVTINNEEEVYVHCFGESLDTTFMLNYFEHNDSVLVCLTGEAFQHKYGHQYGQGHMMNGMMGHSTSGQSSWQHHLNDEHNENDQHFGGFHMGNHTFDYSIETQDGYYHFNGTKN